MKNLKTTKEDGQNINGDHGTEGRVQQECVMWLWNAHPETRGLLCYNLSNSKNKIDGALNKAKGLIKGRADLTFYWNKTAYFIEMKTEKGTQEPEQKIFQATVEKAGYKYVICRSLDDFKKVINLIITLNK